MTVLGTEGSSSVSVQAELAQLKSENARLEAENARLRLEANRASSQLKAQRSHLLAQQDELRYEREVLNQEREQLQLEKARVKEEAEGWGMNRDRNDLIELLSPSRKLSQKQLEPSAEQRARFARVSLGSEGTDSDRHATSSPEPPTDSRRTLRRLSTMSSLARRSSISLSSARLSLARSATSREVGQVKESDKARSAKRRASVVARAAQLLGRPRPEPPSFLTVGANAQGASQASASADSMRSDGWANETSARTDTDDGRPS